MFVICCLRVEYYLCCSVDSGAVVWYVAESLSMGKGEERAQRSHCVIHTMQAKVPGAYTVGWQDFMSIFSLGLSKSPGGTTLTIILCMFLILLIKSSVIISNIFMRKEYKNLEDNPGIWIYYFIIYLLYFLIVH